MTFRGHDFGLSDSETYEKRLETADFTRNPLLVIH